MSREEYRHKVDILRRSAQGGEYEVVATTSAAVVDEKWTESLQTESERIEDCKIVKMRARRILSDDLIRWRGEFFRVVYPDEYNHTGREIRVRVRRSRSRYTVKGEINHAEA